MRSWRAAIALLATACASVAPVPDDGVRLADEVFVQALRPGAWRQGSYHWYPGTGPFPSNGLIVRGEQGAILIDTAWNPEQTAAVLDGSTRAVGPVRAVVVTYAHDDRLGGLSEVHRRGIPSVALAATAELAQQAGWPAIQKPVDSRTRLEPYGMRGEIFHPGAGRTPESAVVFLDDGAILAGTCMVRAADATTLGNLRDADLKSWPAVIEQLQRCYAGAEIVVPGHDAPGGPELLAHTRELPAREVP